MSADPMSVVSVIEVLVIEVQLLDVFSEVPLENTRIFTQWTDDSRTAVVCDRHRIIGYLPALYDMITSVVRCEGVVTMVRRGEDPSVMVRLTVPK